MLIVLATFVYVHGITIKWARSQYLLGLTDGRTCFILRERKFFFKINKYIKIVLKVCKNLGKWPFTNFGDKKETLKHNTTMSYETKIFEKYRETVPSRLMYCCRSQLCHSFKLSESKPSKKP